MGGCRVSIADIRSVDDDSMILAGLRQVLDMKGYTINGFPGDEIFLKDLPFKLDFN